MEEAQSSKPHIGLIAAINKESSVITECAIPNFAATKKYDMPENCGNDFKQLMEEYKDLFCTTPGKSTCHYIPTKGPPVRIPPRGILATIAKKLSHRLT